MNLPDNDGLPISQATRELAHAWHEREGTADQRFFGFVAEWLELPRSTLEDGMLQIFVTTAWGYRTDFLLDLLNAGTRRRVGRGPAVYWLPNECGSLLFCQEDLLLLVPELESKAECPLYQLTPLGVLRLGDKAREVVKKYEQHRTP